MHRQSLEPVEELLLEEDALRSIVFALHLHPFRTALQEILRLFYSCEHSRIEFTQTDISS
jgi:hypothetical protein